MSFHNVSNSFSILAEKKQVDTGLYIPWEEAVSLLQTSTKDAAAGVNIELTVHPDTQSVKGKIHYTSIFFYLPRYTFSNPAAILSDI